MLEIRNLSAGYGKQAVLSDVTISFEKGSVTSVIGKNGCGKSTLLKGMLGLLPDARGEILLDGVSLTSWKRKEIARHVAYLAQGRDLPDMTVARMVLHGRFPHLGYPHTYGKRDCLIADAAMGKMGILSLADCPLETLSGGMRQKAYIAMALAQDTEYILLDEPTTYLDADNAHTLMMTLRALADEGKGIVTVMHDLPLAFTVSDKIIVVNDGKIAAEGSPQMLLASTVTEDVFGVALARAEDGAYYYKYKNG